MRVNPRKLTSALFLFLTTAGCAWVWFSREDPATTQNSSFRLLSSQPLDNFACTYPQSADLSGSLMAASLSSFSFSPLLQEANLPVGGTPAGGDMAPLRTIRDAYSTFVSVAVDPVNGEVVMSDENRFSLLVYQRELDTTGVAEYRRRISGDRSKLEFICGVTIDPISREIYTVNNDTMDNMLVFSHQADGNVAPERELSVDHGAWGIAVDRTNEEIAITIQHRSKIAIYRRTAEGEEPPLRTIVGTHTGLADPHGIFIDTEHNEIFVTNHGAYRQREQISPSQQAAARRAGSTTDESARLEPLQPSTGRFFSPSIRVFSRTAKGDVAPLRRIEGPKTRLNLPQGIAVDVERNLIAVANDGGNSVLFFDRTAEGDVEPLYSIEGPATELQNPSGIWIDTTHNEIWVANWGDHSATVYPRDARGNVAPLRTIRTAPRNTPTPGLGNPGAVAYDSKRDQLLVPN